MGTPNDSSRSNDSEALLNWGFRFYKTYKLFNANNAITTARVWLGQNKHASLGLQNDLYVTIPVGSYTQLKANMALSPSIKAPVFKGQRYGNVIVSLNNKTISSKPLVSLENDPVGGLWTKLTDHIVMLFSKNG